VHQKQWAEITEWLEGGRKHFRLLMKVYVVLPHHLLMMPLFYKYVNRTKLSWILK